MTHPVGYHRPLHTGLAATAPPTVLEGTPVTTMASRRVCTVCCKQQAQYTCPRCHKVYCSSACYKKHSQTCSEAFYREQATEQLKAARAGPEQTREMMEVLQRLHQQQQAAEGFDGSSSDQDSNDSSSEDDSDVDDGPEATTAASQLQHCPALKQLLKRARYDGETFDIRSSDLTPEVIQELESLSLRGQLSHLVTPWEPWWYSDTAAALQLNTAGQRIVQDMQELHTQVQQQQQGNRASSVRSPGAATSSRSSGRDASGVPLPSDEPLPSMQKLAGQAHRPSQLLPWQLLQLLVAYCAVMRQFNGEPEAEGGWEAAHQLLLLAPPLVQAALASSKGANSSGSAANGSAATAQGAQQQQQQAGPSVAPPESVRGACLQLLDAAAVADAASSDGQVQLQEQLATAAAAISGSGGTALLPERRALLQVATADVLQLLKLGRSAVVLALTDSRRLLVGAKDQVKFSLQQHGGKGQQLQKQRRQLQQLRQGFALAGQKVWYLMVWANQQAPMVYQYLAEELGQELQGQQAMTQPSTGVTLTGKAEAVPRIEPVSKPVVVVQSTSNADQAVSASAVKQPMAEEVPVSGLYDLD